MWPLPIDAHTTLCLSMSAPRIPKYGWQMLLMRDLAATG